MNCIKPTQVEVYVNVRFENNTISGYCDPKTQLYLDERTYITNFQFKKRIRDFYISVISIVWANHPLTSTFMT